MARAKQAPDLRENKMGTVPSGRLLLSMALPLAISMLVQAFYNIVDTYFVSLVSTNATGALSLAFPIQHLQIGCATGIAVGMNSLLSKSLGEGDRTRANRAAGNGIFLMLIAAVIFLVFGLFGTKGYYNLFNADQQTKDFGISYTSICSIFSLGVFIEILGERLLQSSGRTIYTLFTQGIGAVLNIILDPLFILGSVGLEEVLGIRLPFFFPAYGVAGAAIATVIGQWVAGILAVIFNFTSNPDVKFRFRYLLPKGDIIRKILVVGIPSILMMAIGSVMNFGMNSILLGFSDVHGQTPANVFGIYFKVQSIFIMPLIGINNASISIVAFNYGARQPKRITTNMKFAFGAAVVIMLLGFAVFQIIPDKIMGIFGSAGGEEAEAMIKMGTRVMRVVSIQFPLAAVGITLSGSFQGLGNGIYSTIISLSRQLIVLLPVAYLLSLTGNVDLIWWAFPIAELVSSILSVIFYSNIYKKKIKPMFATAE